MVGEFRNGTVLSSPHRNSTFVQQRRELTSHCLDTTESCQIKKLFDDDVDVDADDGDDGNEADANADVLMLMTVLMLILILLMMMRRGWIG